MQCEKHLDNAVLIYLFLLITFVVIKMLDDCCIFDIIYLITLVCAVIKCLMIMKECRK